MSSSCRGKSRFVLRCRARGCKAPAQSILKGTILSHSKFDNKAEFVEFVYQWLLGTKQDIIRQSLGWGASTCTDWANYLRECVSYDILTGDDCMIGGPGIIVEIDESKFGKRKYNVRGRVISCSVNSFFSLTTYVSCSADIEWTVAGYSVELRSCGMRRPISGRWGRCLRWSWKTVKHVL